MCNCSDLPKAVIEVSLSWAFRSVKMEGVENFPQYFSGLESEEFEPELNYDTSYYHCKVCRQRWYIYLDSDESPSPWLVIKHDNVDLPLSEKEIEAEKQFLTILAHNGFSSAQCRISECGNLKLKGKELCHIHLTLP